MCDQLYRITKQFKQNIHSTTMIVTSVRNVAFGSQSINSHVNVEVNKYNNLKARVHGLNTARTNLG